MVDKSSSLDNALIEYENLASMVREKLPNIVFPSMGRFEEIGQMNIENKEFIIANEDEEV